MHSFSLRKVLLVVCASLLAYSPSAFGQRNLGQIYGTVTDSSGAVVAGTTVTVTDPARGVTRTLTTDSAGEYSAPSLVPSTYAVRAEAQGFNTAERQQVVVGVGQQVRIDLTLQAGSQNQVVTVTGAPPIINTTTAMISTIVDTQTLDTLPLNGRLYTKVLDYTPGISANPGGGTPTYESNGAGNSNQEWMLDGIDDVNEFAASGPLFGAATSSDELTILPLDSIEEVNVMANPPAEYGWENGAVVNVGLKSGTNTVHGSAYANGRDTALDAKSPYLQGLPKGDDLFEQFGASIGGPIVKDKLFYFGNYEGFRYTEGSPSTVQVPSSLPNPGAASPSQSFPDAIADLEANGVQPNQLSLNLAGCNAQGVCDPTKGVFNNGTTNTSALPTGLDNIGRSDNFLARIDYHPSDKNSINGEFIFGNALDNTAGLGVQPYWGNTDFNRNMVVRAVWVYVPNSRWVNEARFGYDRYDLQDYNTECTHQVGQPNYLKDFGFASGVNAPAPECGFPVLSIAGFTNLGAGQFIQDQLVFQNTWHYLDTVSYVRGKHQMKFGFEVNHTLYRGYGAPNFFDGDVAFNGGLAFPGSSSLEDFLAGMPTLGQVLVNPPQTSLGFNRYAGFFQDDWRIIPRLVLNLGLRYEHEPPIRGNNNSLGNFDPNTPSGMVQQGGGALYRTDWRDFGPRVGFAWDVTGKGTTVIRAGSSVTYDTVPLASLVTSQGANLALVPTGFTLFNADGSIRPSPGNIRSGTASLIGSQMNWVYNAPGASIVPVFNTTGSALSCGNGLGTNPPQCFLLAVNPNLPRSYMLTWTVGVQHAFTNNLSLTAAYVATHAYGLPELVNVNQPAPGTNDPTAEELRRPYATTFPYFGDILQYSAVGYSDYSGLQLSLVQRTSHGLTLHASYTLASAKTTQSPDSDGPPFLKDSTNVSSSYAPMAEPRHNIGLEVTYDIPGKDGFGQMLKGWSVNNAITLRSGLGVDTQDTADDLAGIGTMVVGSYWNLYGTRNDFKNFGKGAAVPCFGAPGSAFANVGCSTAVPQACMSAAASEPTNPNVPSSDPNATGTDALANFGCYMEGNSVIVPPAQGTFGNMFRNEMLGPWFREWNFSVTKEWKLSERFTTQFRADFYNLLNNRNYGFVSGSPNVPAIFGVSLAPVNAGNLVNGTGDARRIALGFKLSF